MTIPTQPTPEPDPITAEAAELLSPENRWAHCIEDHRIRFYAEVAR